MQGKILKGIGGFYYVSDGEVIYECKAKGIFRKDGRKPLVGDDVLMEVLSDEQKLGSITELLPRRSELIRPAVANVDQALIIFSLVKPTPNFNLLDRFLIMMETQKLPCIICFNKSDLDEEGSAESIRQRYESCGYQILVVSTLNGEGVDQLKGLLRNKTTTVAGPSGVGKSSLVNALSEYQVMETGEISTKIDRGKHTTRHTQLFMLEKDTFILDTPGFSSLDLFDVTTDTLGKYYREFTEPEKHCRFAGCSHISEPDCGVKQACMEGRISRERYETYCQLYEELRNKRRYT